MRRLALASFLFAACSTGNAPPALERTIELAPCQLQEPGSRARVPAECGTFRVPEDRARPGGRAIDLRVAVVPAVSRTPELDPLVFFTGGPGQAATESFVSVAQAFRRVRRERDIVLVDQRGTGGSGALRCPKPDDDAFRLWLFDEKAVGAWVEGCLEALNTDPSFYTTTIAMEDLDAVREALGYERVNLYGISYGTRAAISYLRQFPDRVRTVIIDGVVPPTENLGLEVASDAQRALNLLLARCAGDAACSKPFPDPKSDLEALMKRLETPVSVALRHPTTGEDTSLELDRAMAAFAIRLATYSQEYASIVPLLLRTSAEGDLRPLAAQFLIISDQLDTSISDAMGFTVICSEDFPFDTTEASALNEGTYLGSVQTDNLNTFCPLWPTRPIPPDFKDPVRSDAPVLILSGEADPVTPPSNGELVRSWIADSLHITAPGQGHMVIHRGCIPGLAADFIETGRLDSLDASCVNDIEPQAFFTSFAGPPP